MEFYRLEPFGASRDNWHMAVLAMVFANAHRDPKKPAIPPDRFIYTDEETAAEAEDEKLMTFLGKFKPNG